VDFVRLRSGRAYVHAAEDGRSVRLDHRRASHNAVWAVTPRLYPSSGTPCVLLRGAYGRYLGAPDAAAGGSLCPLSTPCRAAKQRDFDKPEIPAIMWRAVATSRQGVFLLHDASGRYLRTNPRWLLPCRAGVAVSSCDGLGRAIQWAVEPVPRAGRPDLPIGCDVSSSSPAFAFLDFVIRSIQFLSPTLSSFWRNSVAPKLQHSTPAFLIELEHVIPQLARVEESINHSITLAIESAKLIQIA
jgi:hypothetical protein